MSQKFLRGKLPSNRRTRVSQSHPSSSPHTHRRRVLARRSPEKVIKRCKSEPALLSFDISVDGAAAMDDHDGVIVQRLGSTDGFLSSQDLVLPYTPAKIEGYDKEAKVVVNVTVEGSPGPVRTMLKLGSSVQETMEIIKKQYNSEGRSPLLDQTFELHQSYFSLHCLDKSDMIGDIGSRSFYMRKSKIISTRGSDSPSPRNPILIFSDFISNSFKRIMRLSRKVSKILGCIER